MSNTDEIVKAHERLGQVLSAAFDANHPAMHDWAKVRFALTSAEQTIGAEIAAIRDKYPLSIIWTDETIEDVQQTLSEAEADIETLLANNERLRGLLRECSQNLGWLPHPQVIVSLRDRIAAELDSSND